MSTKKILGISFLVAFAIVGLFALVPGYFYMSSCIQPSPPRPEITYGEFPFRIEYEIHGDRVVIEDVIICEFDGFFISWGGDGKTRQWKASFASGRESLTRDGAVILVDDVNQIFFSLGGAEYYLGVKDVYFGFHAGQKGGMPIIRHVDQDELFNVYRIKVISYEFSDPIVNTFK